MSERITETSRNDAPLSAAYSPDARASGLTGEEDDELIARTFTIARPRAEVRAFLRQSFNLVDFIAEEDADDASITIEDDSDDGINWRAATSSGRHSSGRIELRDAPAGRGTEITATIAQESRNVLRKAYDKLTQHDPRIRSRRALRRLKQLMETGEIATSEPGKAAPRG